LNYQNTFDNTSAVSNPRSTHTSVKNESGSRRGLSDFRFFDSEANNNYLHQIPDIESYESSEKEIEHWMERCDDKARGQPGF